MQVRTKLQRIFLDMYLGSKDPKTEKPEFGPVVRFLKSLFDRGTRDPKPPWVGVTLNLFVLAILAWLGKNTNWPF